MAEKLCGRSRHLEEAQGFAENKLRVKLQLFVRSGGETKLIARLYFFHILIVDLLWNTADKYKDHNEQYKSAE